MAVIKDWERNKQCQWVSEALEHPSMFGLVRLEAQRESSLESRVDLDWCEGLSFAYLYRGTPLEIWPTQFYIKSIVRP
jgi:hypothetical protein